MTGLGKKQTLWCRFCHAQTEQWVDDLDDHKRVCTGCWRRQRDGTRIEIQDGARMTDPPARESKPPTMPPPPQDDRVPRWEYDELVARVTELERMVTELNRLRYDE